MHPQKQYTLYLSNGEKQTVIADALNNALNQANERVVGYVCRRIKGENGAR